LIDRQHERRARAPRELLSNPDERRSFLLRVSQSYQLIVKAAVDGTYDDTFFGNPKSEDGYRRRLRAMVQNLHLDFAETMRSRGHLREFVDKPKPSPAGKRPRIQPQIVSRERFLTDISELLKRTRGRELPDMFNPLIAGDLFHEQVEPWKRLAENHVKGLWEAIWGFLKQVV
jgi:hypothetical protein